MSGIHGFSKAPADYIYLLSGCGVQGDAHCAKSSTLSNKRQVHLIASEHLTELAKKDSKGRAYVVSPGALGENITTEGIDLVGLSEGTRLHFGNGDDHAIVRITGLRNPKKRLDEWPKGLLDRCVMKNKKGEATGYKIGVMGMVEEDGYVQPGHRIYVEKPKMAKALGNV